FNALSNIDSRLVTRNKEIIKQDEADPYLSKRASVRWFCELETHMELNWRELNQFPKIPLLIHQAGGDQITDKAKAKKWFEVLPFDQKVYKEWSGLYHEVLNEPERLEVIEEMIAWMERAKVDV